MAIIKIKKFTIVITAEDYFDVTLYFEGKKIIKFALNYRGMISNRWCEIYRVDNFHGFLHEQRFWRTKEPILIEQGGKSSDRIVEEYTEQIALNFMKYREYFKKSIKGEKYEK